MFIASRTSSRSVYVSTGQHKKAIADLAEAIEGASDPDDVEPLQERARAYRALEETNKAIADELRVEEMQRRNGRLPDK
jgi:tetratricopeptide (TPR) repeat protein